MANYLILLAGGKGRRFGGDKLSSRIAGIEVRGWSRFYVNPDLWDAIIWVGDTPPDGLELTALAVPGETRHASWLSGARKIAELFGVSDGDKMVFHDVARPFATSHIFETVLAYLDRCDVVFPVLSPSDALRRRTDDSGWETIRREGIYRVQTPQGFKGWVVKKIMAVGTAADIYDEVDLANSFGARVCAVPGEVMNVKITYPEDLLSARHFVEELLAGFGAVGIGADFHLLERADGEGGIPVGGVLVESAYRPVAWSDGDALLHSLVDAILSASGFEGDIGTLFPPGRVDIRKISSAHLLKEVLELVRAWPCQISSVVFTEVKLSPYRERIISSIESLTGCRRVAITFKSLEGLRYDIYGALTVVRTMGGVGFGDKGLRHTG